VIALALFCLALRALGYLGLAWLVADTLRRGLRQIAGGRTRLAVAGGVVCTVGVVAASAIFVVTVAREAGVLDRLLTLR
jgi:hypothetical protein